MSRQKKTRRLTDIMPVRKTDKKTEKPLSEQKLSRYELDVNAREEKRKRRHKGLAAGSRHSLIQQQGDHPRNIVKDPRLGSRKKVPLVVEVINRPEQGPPISSAGTVSKATVPNPILELERLENNEELNRLLDKLEAGKKLSGKDQRFVDDCLDRIAQLMDELGITDEEENDDDLYRTFERIDINQFK